MPTTCHRIKSVIQQGGKRFEVLELQTERPGRLFYAFDPWLASLCERAMQTQQAVMLTWRGTHYGLRLTDVRLLETGESGFERALKEDRT